APGPRRAPASALQAAPAGRRAPGAGCARWRGGMGGCGAWGCPRVAAGSGPQPLAKVEPELGATASAVLVGVVHRARVVAQWRADRQAGGEAAPVPAQA